MLIYTTIQHAFRKANELSCNEYVLLDMVYHLSVNPKNKLGWCYASKETLGNEIGLTRQAIISMINRLCERGLMVRHEETNHLRTTEKWYSVYTCKETLQGVIAEACKETLHPPVKKLYTPCKETLHNNNINNNILNNNNKESLSISEKPILNSPENQKEEEEKTGGQCLNIDYDKIKEVIRAGIKIENDHMRRTYITNLGLKPNHEKAAAALEAEFDRYVAYRVQEITDYPYNNTQEKAEAAARKRCTFFDFNKWTLSDISKQAAEKATQERRQVVTQKEESKEDKNKRLLDLLKKNKK